MCSESSYVCLSVITSTANVFGVACLSRFLNICCSFDIVKLLSCAVQIFGTVKQDSSISSESVDELFTIFDDVRRSAIDASDTITDFIGELPICLQYIIILSANWILFLTTNSF